MPEWKKIIISGSDISQLNNDIGYLTSDTLNPGIVSSSTQIQNYGIFAELIGDNIVSSSAQISYSGITDIPVGIVSSSTQITLGGDLSGTADSATVIAIQNIGITSGEATQLANIDTTTISSTQWGYLGVLDQNLRTTDSVTFGTASISQNLTVGGNLIVNGDLTYLNTTNIAVEDQFILLGSGSVENTDIGIIFDGTGGTNGTGTAFFYDGTVDRLSYADSVSHTATSVTPDAYIPLVFDVTGASQTPIDAVGNMKIESGEAYIYI